MRKRFGFLTLFVMIFIVCSTNETTHAKINEIDDFYSFVDPISVEAEIINDEEFYFVLDKKKVLVFNEDLNLVQRVNHLYSSNYELKIISDIDSNGYKDLMLINKEPTDKHSPRIIVASLETGEIIWKKNVAIEEMFSQVKMDHYLYDYQLVDSKIILSYGYYVDVTDIYTGKSIKKVLLENDVWSIAEIIDVNEDGVRDIAAAVQPNKIYILDGVTLKEINCIKVDDEISLNNDNKLTSNIWSIRFNEDNKLLGMVTESGKLYELDINTLSIINTHDVIDIYETVAYTKLSRYKEEGYSNHYSASFKNLSLEVIGDIDGDNIGEYLLFHYVPIYDEGDIVGYYKTFKIVTSQGVINEYNKYLIYDLVDQKHAHVLTYGEYSNTPYHYIDLENNEVIVEVDEHNYVASTNEKIFVLDGLEMELYDSDGALLIQTNNNNSQYFEVNKYAYIYDEYNSKIKRLIQYNRDMEERYKFVAPEGYYIDDWHLLDENEDLIYLCLKDDSDNVKIVLFDILNQELIDEYEVNINQLGNVRLILPILDIDSDNDQLLLFRNEQNDLKTYTLDLHTGEETTFDDFDITAYLVNRIQDIEVKYDFNHKKLNYILLFKKNIINIKYDFSENIFSSEQVDVEDYGTLAEITNKIDYSNADMYDLLLSFNSKRDNLLFDISENQIVNVDSIAGNGGIKVYPANTDYDGDGIDDFFGATRNYDENDDATITLFIASIKNGQVKTIWERELDIYMPFYPSADFRPIEAFDNEHILFYTVSNFGQTIIYKVNIETNKTEEYKLIDLYEVNPTYNIGIDLKKVEDFYMFNSEMMLFIIDKDFNIIYIHKLITSNYKVFGQYIFYKDRGEVKSIQLQNKENRMEKLVQTSNKLELNFDNEKFNYAVIIVNDYEELIVNDKNYILNLPFGKNFIRIVVFNDDGSMNYQIYNVEVNYPYLRYVGLLLSSIIISVIIYIGFKKSFRKKVY